MDVVAAYLLASLAGGSRAPTVEDLRVILAAPGGPSSREGEIQRFMECASHTDPNRAIEEGQTQLGALAGINFKVKRRFLRTN